MIRLCWEPTVPCRYAESAPDSSGYPQVSESRVSKNWLRNGNFNSTQGREGIRCIESGDDGFSWCRRHRLSSGMMLPPLPFKRLSLLIRFTIRGTTVSPFVEESFHEDDKQHVLQIVKGVEAAFDAVIHDADWLSPNSMRSPTERATRRAGETTPLLTSPATVGLRTYFAAVSMNWLGHWTT